MNEPVITPPRVASYRGLLTADNVVGKVMLAGDIAAGFAARINTYGKGWRVGGNHG